MTNRKRYGAKVKAKVAVEALREERRTAERARQYDIHPLMITGWKRTAPLNMASAVGARSAAAPQISAGEVEMLHARIGQRVVERGFLSAASSLGLGTGGKRR